MPNPYAVAARAKKVYALVEFLVKAKVTLADVEDALDDDGWELAARGAGVKLPSRETRLAVIEVMRAREGRLDRGTGGDMGPEVADGLGVDWSDLEGIEK